MTRDEILAAVNEVFRDNFCDDTIVVDEKTTAADVPAWDSLEHINLITEIEDCFGIRFKMKEVTGMKNVGEMLDIIAERTGK